MAAAGARGPPRARGDVAHGPTPHPAHALRAAKRAGPASKVDAALRAVHLRSPRRATNPPPARAIDLANDPLGAPLKRRYEHGFEYSDCFADDSRLVVLSALDAAE